MPERSTAGVSDLILTPEGFDDGVDLLEEVVDEIGGKVE